MKNNMRHPLRGVCVCVCWVCLSFALIVQTVHFSFLQENENRPQQGFCPSLPLSSLQTVGSLLLHKQLGLMSSNLALMTDSASVPAGSKKPMRTLWKFTPTHISNNRYGICYGIFVIKLFFLLTFPLIKMPPIREDGAMERIAEKKRKSNKNIGVLQKSAEWFINTFQCLAFKKTNHRKRDIRDVEGNGFSHLRIFSFLPINSYCISRFLSLPPRFPALHWVG